MDYQLIITIAVIICAMIFFATELLSIDLVALCVMVVWVVAGILSPEESFAGFSNSATLTVAAMFILSDALLRSGIIQVIAPITARLFSKSFGAAVFGMSIGTSSISAFINNTPVVATLIPIVSKSAKKLQMEPNKFLIPLSYGAILGGSCTLLGTSTNLLVAGIAANNKATQINLFTMTPIGLVFVAVGLIYLIFISKYLLPKKSKRKTLEDDNSIKTFFTEVQINKLSEDKKGATIQELFEEKDLKVEVKRLKRGDEIENNPSPSKILQEKDVLLISGAMDKVRQVIEDNDLSIRSNINEKSFPEEGTKMVEVIIMPRTQLVGKKLKNVNFLKNYQARVLAIRQRGKRKFSNLENLRLKIGDVLLLQTNENGYELLKNDENNPNAPFLSVKETAVEIPQKKNLYLTCSVVLGVIVLASLNILPIVIAAWAGVAILVIFRILSMTDTYQAIDWKVIFLLAGSLSFGAAMKSSGLTQIIAEYLMSFLKDTGGQMMIIATLYLITMVFTEIMSNNAAAALLAPVVIALAQIMGLNTTPLLITVMMAGSASFMTPIGYQTNTMVYSAGNYKFTDFFKVGAPLSLLLWITASTLIPIIYPLQ